MWKTNKEFRVRKWVPVVMMKIGLRMYFRITITEFEDCYKSVDQTKVYGDNINRSKFQSLSRFCIMYTQSLQILPKLETNNFNKYQGRDILLILEDSIKYLLTDVTRSLIVMHIYKCL